MLNRLHPLKIYNESIFIFFSTCPASGDIAMQNLKSLILFINIIDQRKNVRLHRLALDGGRGITCATTRNNCVILDKINYFIK